MPSPAGKSHDRASIVTAALRILDSHGLADLTMRRLAAELDVRPSAIYWHIESKQVLLGAVADAILGGADTPPEADAATIAGALREALLAHRDGADVVLSTIALALGASAPMSRLEAALTVTANPTQSARLVMQFVLGHTSIVQQRHQAAALGVLATDLPTIRRDADVDFARGISALIDGLS